MMNNSQRRCVHVVYIIFQLMTQAQWAFESTQNKQNTKTHTCAPYNIIHFNVSPRSNVSRVSLDYVIWYFILTRRYMYTYYYRYMTEQLQFICDRMSQVLDNRGCLRNRVRRGVWMSRCWAEMCVRALIRPYLFR